MTNIRPSEAGNSSDVTALVECEKGPFFVKAFRNRPGGRRDSLIREESINPHVVPLSPTVLWRVEDEAWLAIGFEVIEGRPADFTPDSRDLPAVIDLLNRIGGLPLPEVARDWPETRWDRFTAGNAEAAMFQGDSLLHTDINQSNLIIGAGRTWVVDWSWPTRGAAFIDAALLVFQLIAAGHTALAAETLAAGCVAWADADPRAIDAFAAANLRMYRRRADRYPNESWLEAMVAAGRRWTEHRGVVAQGH
ncbi:protein kinase [Actinomadura macra]|uniref:protein kinase n=1 Tax=Actinomadura macra TaxID=46164 RepID=UPI001FDFEAF9|nr:protein kinase [Actinomadura macra]